jgi:hypothetical protein
MTRALGASVLFLALVVGGCTGGGMDFDIPPPDSGWQPQGVNAVNISVMAAHPADLVRGHGEAGALGQEATPAVERLWSGRVKSLPASDIGAGGSTDTASAQPPPAGAGQQPGSY